MTFRVSRFLAVATAAALVLGAHSASAEVLVYDGFDLSKGYKQGDITENNQPSTAYLSAQTGFAAKVWGNWSNTGVVYVHGSGKGLAYPASGWDGFTAVDSSVGFNHSDKSGGNRAGYRELAPATAFASCGKLYFRILASCVGTPSKLVNGSVYGLGLCNAALDGTVNGKTGTFGTTGLWLGIRHDGSGVIKAILDLRGTQYELCTMTANTTYVMVAEISVGTGADGLDEIRAFATPVGTYSNYNVYWASSVGTGGVAEGTFVRNAKVQLKYLVLNGEYGTQSQRIVFDEVYVGTELGDVVPAVTTRPELKDGTLSLSGGTYTATALLTNSAANVSYVLSNGTTATTNAIAAYANGDTVTGTFVSPSDDTTYEVLLMAENQSGETAELSLGTVYGGTLSLAKVSDGSEVGVEPATLTVSRAGADPLPLVVNYSFTDGTAVAGTNYVNDACSVTIPAGQASATIAVHPLVDVATATDTAMTVSISTGNYTAPAAGVSVTIANFTTPAGLNYWVGSAATDGEYLASNGDNWSLGRAPNATETAVFDGDFSTADCTWDAAAPHVVGAWTQTNGYTGSVVFKTTFADADTAFTNFTISGDAAISSGKWTVPTATSGQTSRRYRVKVSIGGRLSIASGTSVTVTGKGPWPAANAVSYGGQADSGAAYGNVLDPADPGSGWPIPGGASGEYNHPAFGGGAIWLEVAGATTLNGSILANGGYTKGWDHYYGSGGGIYLKTASLSGTGSISSDGNSTGGSNGGCASAGGRISILLTDESEMSLPLANVHAYGSSEYGLQGGAGTIVLRTTSLVRGRLIVRNRENLYGQYHYYPTKERTTPVLAGETWTFDEIVFGANGVLRVPTGATLSLPNGLASVSGSSALSAERTSCGILLDGGTLDVADTTATEHVVGNGQWMLSPNAPLALNGNLTVQGGAAVGAIHVRNTATNRYNKMDLTVKGDMTVASDGYILTEGAGLNGTGDDKLTLYAGTTYGSHGGAYGCLSDTETPSDAAYDSILSPTLPGNRSGVIQRYTSGVAFLTVKGAFTLNGTASANAVGGHWYGSAGSLNFTVGSLSGTGGISANGNQGGNWDADGSYHMYPGGGRISVRLTDAGATFSEHWSSHIHARGVAWNAGDGTRLHHSTAGTVYLQDGTQPEGAGTVRIFQNNAAVNWTTVCTNDFTAFPSTRHGGENDDLRRVSLAIGGGAHVFLTKDVRTKSLVVAQHSTLNLYGRTLTIDSCHLNGVKVPSGTYTAGQLQTMGRTEVVDTSAGAGGTLIVRSGGTVIMLK